MSLKLFHIALHVRVIVFVDEDVVCEVHGVTSLAMRQIRMAMLL
jgi:hypothetical protein